MWVVLTCKMLVCWKFDLIFSGITEECFQKTPLKASSEYQWVQFGKDGPRFQFVANRTTVGTYPEGSEWTKNPIPACNKPGGGFFSNETLKCTDGTQFPPPLPGIEGFGIGVYGGKKRFPYSIVDQLQVPQNLIPGDYVLSFRWDCEQTSQVWNTCANIKVVKSILGNWHWSYWKLIHLSRKFGIENKGFSICKLKHK